MTLARLIERFADVHVAVVGDAMLDSWLEGNSDRLSPEAPVPVVSVSQRTDLPGGAANVAANVASLGGRASLISLVGDDEEAGLLRTALETRGIATNGLVAQGSRRTLSKNRVVSDSQMIVRFDRGSTGSVPAAAEQTLMRDLQETFDQCDAVIISDYGYGALSPRVIEALSSMQARHPRLIVADSKDLTAYRDVGITAAKPNYGQAARLLGIQDVADKQARAGMISARGPQLLQVTGAQLAAVTLDTDGAVFFEEDRPPYRTYARPQKSSSAAGAGDTFISALTLALAAGADTPAAAELSSAAASVVVGADKTTACSASDLEACFSVADKYWPEASRLAGRLDLYRKQRRRVVFTNGCFDILHRGHIAYLNRAKTLGDILVVAVNTDSGVRRLKGPSRPINSLEDRVEVLAGLSSVDHVVSFDEDTPVRLLEALSPDVFVKGGDYTLSMLPEAPVVEELGGRVEILPYVQDRSTSGLIERIRADRDTVPSASSTEGPGA